MDEQHPALKLNGDPAVIAEAIRQALASVIGLEAGTAEPMEQDSGPSSGSAGPTDSEMLGEPAMGTEHQG